MNKSPFLLILFTLFFLPAHAQKEDSITIKKIFNEELTNGKCYHNLDYLSNTIGGRLAGSPEAAKAVEWGYNLMKEQGFDTVFLQEMMVPHWVRGAAEKAYFKSSSGKKIVSVCALGNSIGTPSKGITASVVEVHDFDELKKLGKEKVEGKIVFFNRAFDETKINTFEAYGGAVNQRGQGAIQAAKLGAVGVVVRSMTNSLDDFPHTGAMRYDKEVTRIPAVAISTIGANLLSENLKADPGLSFYMKTNCMWMDSVLSYNVVGQINGTAKMEEFIVVGGHLDSWDTGDGAMDDGAGIVQSLDAIKLFRSVGIRPVHSLRCVFFMNEENGLRGGVKYAQLAKQNGEKHLAAIETDRGGFAPVGFSINRGGDTLKYLNSWIPILKPYGIAEFTGDGGGADISPLESQGVPLLDLVPESQRYFDYHHAPSDTFDKINRRELQMGAASLASLIYLLDKYGFR